MRLTAMLGLPLAMAASPHAAAQPAPAHGGQHEQVVQRVLGYVQDQTRGLPGKVQVTVNPLDERTRLAPCDDLQVFTPQGARLWGQTSVGVRCVRPQPWQVFVPVTVRVSGQVVVANRPLAAGSVIDAADIGSRAEELTTLPPSVLLDPANAVGRTLASGVAAGAALRSENLKQVLAVVQGQAVRVIYESSTLSVSAEGKALGNAAVGQGVDVRVGSGKTVRGIARESGVVVVK